MHRPWHLVLPGLAFFLDSDSRLFPATVEQVHDKKKPDFFPWCCLSEAGPVAFCCLSVHTLALLDGIGGLKIEIREDGGEPGDWLCRGRSLYEVLYSFLVIR